MSIWITSETHPFTVRPTDFDMLLHQFRAKLGVQTYQNTCILGSSKGVKWKSWVLIVEEMWPVNNLGSDARYVYRITSILKKAIYKATRILILHLESNWLYRIYGAAGKNYGKSSAFSTKLHCIFAISRSKCANWRNCWRYTLLHTCTYNGFCWFVQ